MPEFNQVADIRVIGVGGGGSNAVNRMVADGVKGVDFYIANTDVQVMKTVRQTINWFLDQIRQMDLVQADSLKSVIKPLKNLKQIFAMRLMAQIWYLLQPEWVAEQEPVQLL